MAVLSPLTVAAGVVRSARLPDPVFATMADDHAWLDALAANPHLTTEQFDSLASRSGSATWRARVVWHPKAAGRLAELLEGERRRLPWQAALVAHHDEAAALACRYGMFDSPVAADLADLIVARFPSSSALPTAALAARPQMTFSYLRHIEPHLDDRTVLAVLARIGGSVLEHWLVHCPVLRWVCATRPAVARGIVSLEHPGPLLAPAAVAGVDTDLAPLLLDRAVSDPQASSTAKPFVLAALASSPFVPAPLADQAARQLSVADRYQAFALLSRSTSAIAADTPVRDLSPSAARDVFDAVRRRDGDPSGRAAYSAAGAITAWSLVHLAARADFSSEDRAAVARLFRPHSHFIPPHTRSALRARLEGRVAPAPRVPTPRSSLIPEGTLGPTPAQWVSVPVLDAANGAVAPLSAFTRPLVTPVRGRRVVFDPEAANRASTAAAAVTDQLGADVDRWRALLAIADDLPESTTVAEAATISAALQ